MLVTDVSVVILTAFLVGLIKWTHVPDVVAHNNQASTSEYDEVEPCMEDCQRQPGYCLGIEFDNYNSCKMIPVSPDDDDWFIFHYPDTDYYYVCAFGELGKPGM